MLSTVNSQFYRIVLKNSLFGFARLRPLGARFEATQTRSVSSSSSSDLHISIDKKAYRFEQYLPMPNHDRTCLRRLQTPGPAGEEPLAERAFQRVAPVACPGKWHVGLSRGSGQASGGCAQYSKPDRHQVQSCEIYAALHGWYSESARPRSSDLGAALRSWAWFSPGHVASPRPLLLRSRLAGDSTPIS
jgi:hypothetical protein